MVVYWQNMYMVRVTIREIWKKVILYQFWCKDNVFLQYSLIWFSSSLSQQLKCSIILTEDINYNCLRDVEIMGRMWVYVPQTEGRLRGLTGSTLDHRSLTTQFSWNLGEVISEGCFIFDFASLPLEVALPI